MTQVDPKQPDSDGVQAMSFEGLMALAREKRMYAKNGLVTVVPGQLVSSMLDLGTSDAVKSRINDLVSLVKRGPTPDWRNPDDAEAARDAVANAIGDAQNIAEASIDSAELHYLAGMFIHHHAVLRSVARNPAISEKTQMMLASDPVLKQDRGIQLELAHNRALTADVMKQMYNGTDDAFVLTGLAMNAAAQSRRSRAACAFGDLCLEMAKSMDPGLRVIALAGVKDAAYLGQVAVNKNPFLAPKELYAIAANANTPLEALEHIAATPLPGVQKAFGFQAADRARATLANIRYEKGLSSENTAPAY